MKKSFLKQAIPKKSETGKQLDLTITGFANLNSELIPKNSIKNENEPLKQLKSNKKDMASYKQVSFQDFGEMANKTVNSSKVKDDLLFKKQTTFN